MPGHADYSEPVQWMNAAAFGSVPVSSQNVPLRVGTAPRNLSLRYYNMPAETMRLSKAFALWNEKSKLRMGMTLTNPFKRQSTYVADTGWGDSAFGQVYGSGGGRQMQLDARIDF